MISKVLLLIVSLSVAMVAVADDAWVKTGCYKITIDGIQRIKGYIQKENDGKINFFFDHWRARVPGIIGKDYFEAEAIDGTQKIYIKVNVDANNVMTGYYERSNISAPDHKRKCKMVLVEDIDPKSLEYWENTFKLQKEHNIDNRPLPPMSPQLKELIIQRAKTMNISLSKIDGKVTDLKENPIPGAIIKVTTMRYDADIPMGIRTDYLTTTSNRDGNFTVKNILAFSMNISCASKGFETFSQQIKENDKLANLKDQSFNIILNPEIKKTPESSSLSRVQKNKTSVSSSSSLQQAGDTRQNNKVDNFQLRENLRQAVIKYFKSGNKPALKNDCLKAAEMLLKENENNVVESIFIYAKVNWMLGEYTSAINALNKIINEHPSAETEPFNAPASINARFWLAAIMEETNKVSHAGKIYQEIIKQIKMDAMNKKWVLMVYANLYLCEIELQEHNSTMALNALNDIINYPCPSDVPSALKITFLKYAEFNIKKIKNSAQQAQETRTYDNTVLNQSVFIPILGLKIKGITPSGPGFLDETAVYILSLKRCMEKSSNKTSKVFASIILGADSLRKNDYATAATYFKMIFEGDSFWAPEAGQMLIDCLDKQGKQKEKNEIIENMKKRFPEYAATQGKGIINLK